MLTLRNPHSVLAVLETRPQDIVSLRIPDRIEAEGWEKVQKLARQKGVKIQAPQKRSQSREEGGRASLAEADVKEREGIPAETLFQGASEKKSGHGLWIALDSLQDPHNVGAIFRTAAFFGAEGVLLTQERSAPLSATAYDVAAGGLEYVPFTLQTNLQRAFEIAKEAGLWILGTSEHANDQIQKIERDRPWLLVLGNEERGLRRLTQESCDVLCQVPPAGRVTSLNVSVAAGILIAHLSL